MQATRQDIYMQSRFSQVNSFLTAMFYLATVVCVAGTFVGAFGNLPF